MCTLCLCATPFSNNIYHADKDTERENKTGAYKFVNAMNYVALLYSENDQVKLTREE